MMPHENVIVTDEPGWQRVLWHSRKMAMSLIDKMEPGWRILEIGPGFDAFPKATDFVDRPLAATDGHPKRANTSYVDICRERLPFVDRHFDFVFCRHVLEDLYDPFLVLGEMQRVAKRGYIETPSPFAELCRGVDGRMAQHRGCHHHRWIVWEEANAIHFVEKSVLAEHMHILDFKDTILANPSIANTYYAWEGDLRVKHWQHDHDFRLQVDYDKVLHHAIEASVESWRRQAVTLG